ALARNHDIAIEYESVRIGSAGASRAHAAYEPTLGFSVSYRDHTDPVNSLFSGAPEGKDAPHQTGAFTQASVAQLLPTGRSFSFSAGAPRDPTDTSFATLSPAYPTSVPPP